MDTMVQNRTLYEDNSNHTLVYKTQMQQNKSTMECDDNLSDNNSRQKFSQLWQQDQAAAGTVHKERRREKTMEKSQQQHSLYWSLTTELTVVSFAYHGERLAWVTNLNR
jgi:hypothetical protein